MMKYLTTGNRETIGKKKRIVVKVGTSSLTYDHGKVNFRYMGQAVVGLKEPWAGGHFGDFWGHWGRAACAGI